MPCGSAAVAILPARSPQQPDDHTAAMTRQRAGDSMLAAALLIGSASGWLTWTRSGSANRNSYESLRSAQRLGIEELAPFRVAWFCVPVIAAAAVVLLVAGFRRSALGCSALVGLTLLAFGGGMLLTPVASGAGPWAACLCGTVLLTVAGVRIAQEVVRR